ncbi:transposable element Tcb2 transposase [Trichonephila clavipes]|nr:transposable element Tcb2 transposase [Trichonephila clavipes]
MWSMVAQRLTQITPPATTPDQLWQRVEAAWSAVPQEHIQSLFESMPRRVAAWFRVRGNSTAVEWKRVIFSDESRFNLSSDDNRIRVWRHRGQRLNPSFALQQHTTPVAGVMVWSVIACNTLSLLIFICSTMTAQRHVHGILQPNSLLIMQRLPGAIFQQDNTRPDTKRVSEDSVHTVTTLHWPASSPDLSPIEHIWDHFGWGVGHPRSLNELETGVQ